MLRLRRASGRGLVPFHGRERLQLRADVGAAELELQHGGQRLVERGDSFAVPAGDGQHVLQLGRDYVRELVSRHRLHGELRHFRGVPVRGLNDCR